MFIQFSHSETFGDKSELMVYHLLEFSQCVCVPLKFRESALPSVALHCAEQLHLSHLNPLT